jgi:hypothetical protein
MEAMNGGSFSLRAVIESGVENPGAHLLLSGGLFKAEGRGFTAFLRERDSFLCIVLI